jgi:hypothetical protein
VNTLLDQGTVVFVHRVVQSANHAMASVNKSGRCSVKVDGADDLFNAKSKNILAKHRADFDADTTPDLDAVRAAHASSHCGRANRSCSKVRLCTKAFPTLFWKHLGAAPLLCKHDQN